MRRCAISVPALLALALLALVPAAIRAVDESQTDKRAELRQINQQLAQLSRAFNLIHEIVAPSVVAIHTHEIIPTYEGIMDQEGDGSGFVFASDSKYSYIITNAHVVLVTNRAEFVPLSGGGYALYDKIHVNLHDNREFRATCQGYWTAADIAVLRIDIPNLPAVEWADSDKGRVGDWVLALGYPLNIGYSATSGIISATDRMTGSNPNSSKNYFDSFIQTDAAINPGNSGGPLVNIMGQVIGINARLISRTGASAGIGLAIPSDLARRVAEEILAHGHFSQPIIGIQLGQDLSAKEVADAHLVRVDTVEPGYPAEAAGLKVGDYIIAIDQSPITSNQQFRARLFRCKIGSPTTVRIRRGDTESDHQLVPISQEAAKRILEAKVKETEEHDGVQLIGYGLWLAQDDRPGLRITKVEDNSVASDENLEPGDRVLKESNIGQLTSTGDLIPMERQNDLILQIYHSSTGQSEMVHLRR